MSTTTFRRLALAEGVSYLLLLVATAVKYGAAQEVGVQVLGPIHGVIVLGYVAGALLLRREQRWTPVETILVIVASAVPLGALVVERRVVAPPPPVGSEMPPRT